MSGNLAVGKAPGGHRVRVEVEGPFDIDPQEAIDFGRTLIRFAEEILGLHD